MSFEGFSVGYPNFPMIIVPLILLLLVGGIILTAVLVSRASNKSEAFFKALFCILTTLVGIMVLAGAVLFVHLALQDVGFPIFLFGFYGLIFLVFMGVYIALPVFIFHDAPKHGMNKWMWMTIVTYVPNFIGLIIYFVVRSNSRSGTYCRSCGKQVVNDFDVCPYCGKKLHCTCTSCGKPVGADWTICPYCKNDVNQD